MKPDVYEKGMELAVKRLETIWKRLDAITVKQGSAFVERIQELMQYKNEYEAQEAYGFGDITEEEYRQVLNGFDATPPKTKEMVAQEIIGDALRSARRELHDYHWDRLPEEEKERILAEKEARLARKETNHETHPI